MQEEEQQEEEQEEEPQGRKLSKQKLLQEKQEGKVTQFTRSKADTDLQEEGDKILLIYFKIFLFFILSSMGNIFLMN
ncbi:MAG: hypothetical protein ACE5J3_04850 [Methanosarcinales archaeon]